MGFRWLGSGMTLCPYCKAGRYSDGGALSWCCCVCWDRDEILVSCSVSLRLLLLLTRTAHRREMLNRYRDPSQRQRPNRKCWESVKFKNKDPLLCDLRTKVHYEEFTSATRYSQIWFVRCRKNIGHQSWKMVAWSGDSLLLLDQVAWRPGGPVCHWPGDTLWGKGPTGYVDVSQTHTPPSQTHTTFTGLVADHVYPLKKWYFLMAGTSFRRIMHPSRKQEWLFWGAQWLDCSIGLFFIFC